MGRLPDWKSSHYLSIVKQTPGFVRWLRLVHQDIVTKERSVHGLRKRRRPPFPLPESLYRPGRGISVGARPGIVARVGMRLSKYVTTGGLATGHPGSVAPVMGRGEVAIGAIGISTVPDSNDPPGMGRILRRRKGVAAVPGPCFMGTDPVLFKVVLLVAGRVEVGASLPQDALRAIIEIGSMAGTTGCKAIPPHLIPMPERIGAGPLFPTRGGSWQTMGRPPGMAGESETAHIHPSPSEQGRGVPVADLAGFVAETPELSSVESVLEGVIIDGRSRMGIVMTRETRLLIIFPIEILSVAGLADGFPLLKHEAAVESLGGGIRLPVGGVREEDVAAAESVAGGLPAGGADPALEIGSVAILAVSEAHGGHVVPVKDERAGIGRRLPGFAVAPNRGIPGGPVRAHRTIVAGPETP